jgi:alcohol dehydrogenase
MMAAAAAGATAFQKGLGAIHALSHPVGALYNTHHGLTNAVFAPYVLVFNRKAIEDKVKRLAAYIGLRPSFRAFLDFVLELREQLAIPHTLAGLKIGDDKVDQIVKMAPEDPTAGGNPVKLDRRAARTIFMRALEGRI